MESMKLRIDSFLKSHAKRCAYCGAPFQFGEGKTIDHINAQSRGLDESGINKVVCCQLCNSRKSDMSLREFRKIVDKSKISQYLEDFGDLQLPTGEYYAGAIRKKFGIRVDC